LTYDKDAERSKIIEWLEPTLNPSLLHNEALKKHEQKTSTWLPRTPEWRSFFDQNSESGFLWIYGVPGCGKTVLASFIVDQIRIHCNATPGSCYAYYYCHYSHKEDESIPFMQWIITQICRYTRWVPPELKELYDRGLDAKLAELEDIFEIVLDRVEALYLVLDAVDESEPREDLIALIQRLVIHKQFRKVKIVATSREYSDIRQVFLSISDSLSMSNPEVDSDIQLYVRSKLTTNHRLKRWQSMHDEIEKTLVLKAQGM
jgi:Cdc6-like AAA superfamily ATPase